eukprot:TRINITY_DN16719_c0_g1_i1.p1 TRINITY_DN16719_c0_g1~~TRINITY_DN16719_c0_g1_i1.p1  ORF type:complete len:416 (+),score=103.88 TRINITY_DN16719_c0_g1_i1:446-1693(+)
MLQQTRVDAVVPYFTKWMQRFPTPLALAAATPDEVNAVWAGLGYYRRARMLHAGAKALCKAPHFGELPRTAQELKKVPGIGEYTAAAVSSIAFGAAEPVVDGNVLRVLSRLCCVAADLKHRGFKEKLAPRLAAQLLDPASPGDFNQAMMELGATLCAPQWSPEALPQTLRRHFRCLRFGPCKELPPPAGCSVCAAGMPQVVERLRCVGLGSLLPLTAAALKVSGEHVAVAALRRRASNSSTYEWLMARRPQPRTKATRLHRSDGLLAGQWEFPAVVCAAASTPDGGPAPEAGARRQRLQEALKLLLTPTAQAALEAPRRQAGKVRHDFSGLRQTYWVEYADVGGVGGPQQWSVMREDCDTEVEWMSSARMAAAGVTSAVSKIRACIVDTGSLSTLLAQGSGAGRPLKRPRTTPTV